MTAAMADTEALQKVLFAEMRGRIKKRQLRSVKDGPLAYGTSFVTGGEQHATSANRAMAASALLDGDKSRERDYSVAGIGHSTDHSLGILGL